MFSSNFNRWFAIIIQLGIVTFVIQYFQIEGDLGFPRFWYLIILAFTIHSISKPPFRPQLFLCTFIVVLYLTLGLKGTIKFFILGGFLLTLCHIPISILFRKVLVFIFGAILGLMVIGYLPSFLNSHQLRIFATIFMFRTILYLHELPHEKHPIELWQRLNYFFLPPNIIFPLFPIVDYRFFQKTYYDSSEVEIYKKGVDLILVSVLCLLIYRVIYLFGIPRIQQLVGLWSVAHYSIATYLTVIRLIGLLSLSVGILRLFGYNLPRIFNNMFFASSFVDLFRRINIYWKDFLMKVIYYPAYFKIRKITPLSALTISVLITYFFTWFFHIYQWFWVLGSNPLRENSVIFWGLFGIFASLNTLWEKSPSKFNPSHSLTYRYALIHVSKVMFTFLTMCLLYTMWVSPTINSWTRLLAVAINDTGQNWFVLFGILAVFWLVTAYVYYIYLRYEIFNSILKSINTKLSWGLSMSYLGLILVFNMQIPNYNFLSIYKENQALNEKDNINDFAGYYDEILSVKPDIASKLWSQNAIEPAQEYFDNKDFVRPVNNVMTNELIPNSTGTFKHKKFTTNEWGMRDRNYEKIPAQGTFRIAIVGGSPTMGAGVNDDEVFEQLIEDWLNLRYGNDTLRFEILNFAMSITCAFQHAYILDQKISQFQPQIVLDIEHCRPFLEQVPKLERIVNSKAPMYRELDSLVRETPIDIKELTSDIDREKMGEVLAAFGFQQIIKISKKHGIRSMWVFIPTKGDGYLLDEHVSLARKAGFEEFIILDKIYDNYNHNILEVGPGDWHPNALGHKIIAEALYKELVIKLGLNMTVPNDYN